MFASFIVFIEYWTILIMSLPSAIRITSKSPTSAIIFFHGLGDTGQGWSWFPQLVKASKIIPDAGEGINYVFPNAPEIPITVNGGMKMPAWFNIYGFGDPTVKQDAEGYLKSCELVKGFVKEQMDTYNIPADRIILGGFSQGAAIAYGALATLDIKIGGVIILFGFIPVKDEIAKRHLSTNYDTPVFQGHGTMDNIIGYTRGVETSEYFKALGFKAVKFNRYVGVAHSASDEELTDVQNFVNDVLK